MKRPPTRMTAVEQIVNFSADATSFRHTVASPAQIRSRVQEGLPYPALDTVRERLGRSLPETAPILDTPLRTLARRRERRLQASESDRLYRVARIYSLAVQTLGDEDAAAKWLRRPVRALNGEAPLQLLDPEVGTRLVADVLGRIEYGALS